MAYLLRETLVHHDPETPYVHLWAVRGRVLRVQFGCYKGKKKREGQQQKCKKTRSSTACKTPPYHVCKGNETHTQMLECAPMYASVPQNPVQCPSTISPATLKSVISGLPAQHGYHKMHSTLKLCMFGTFTNTDINIYIYMLPCWLSIMLSGLISLESTKRNHVREAVHKRDREIKIARRGRQRGGERACGGCHSCAGSPAQASLPPSRTALSRL